MKKRFIIGYLLLIFGSIELVAAIFLLLVYFNAFKIIIKFRCVIEILVGLHLIRKANFLRQAGKYNEET